MPSRPTLLLALLALASCRNAPSRDVALAAIRAAHRSIDSAVVLDTVWADGPPWFSCAEVLTKARGPQDTAVVKHQVGNWRSLLIADWISLRDTMAKPVADPGWCVLSLRDSVGERAKGWLPFDGDTLPTGSRRRGWRVTTGRYRIGVKDAPRSIGSDSAAATWYRTIDANENGKALGADRDSLQQRALLVRTDGRWVVP